MTNSQDKKTQSNPKPYARVIVLAPTPLSQPFFHYLNQPDLKPGQLVRVPFGNRKLIGLIIGFDDHSDFTAKEISEILPYTLPDYLVSSLLQTTKYFLTSSSSLLKAALPRFIREGKFPELHQKWVKIIDPDFSPRGAKQKLVYEKLQQAGECRLSELREIASLTVLQNLAKKDIITTFTKETPPPHFSPPVLNTLTPEQISALNQIKKSSLPALLHGVTGSGKTELYLHLAAEALKQNQSVLLLVPEISLTPQLVGRFTEHFPKHIAVMHSHLSDTERARAWAEAASGLKKIIIGSRSAVFAPLPNLRLIILDEYHDESFKQTNHPFYDARKVAEFLAASTGAKLVFGSATPRVEDYYFADTDSSSKGYLKRE